MGTACLSWKTKVLVICMDKLEQYIANHKHISGSAGVEERKYNCLDCKDIGWTMIMQNGHEAARKCKCYELSHAKKLMKKSGISEEFQKKKFENFDILDNPQLSNAKRKAVAYVENFIETENKMRNSIMFSGQVGSGKTHLGTAICGELMRMGIAVVYMAYRETVTRLKQHITDETKYDRELKQYMRARVLYIDDLLKGKPTEADVNIMYGIVNYRYMNCLPVIVSTEKSLDEILMFDEAVGSRLIEMCRKNIISLQGKDLNYRMGRR